MLAGVPSNVQQTANCADLLIDAMMRFDADDRACKVMVKMVLKRTGEIAAKVRAANAEAATAEPTGGTGSTGAGLATRIAVMEIRQTQQMGR